MGNFIFCTRFNCPVAGVAPSDLTFARGARLLSQGISQMQHNQQIFCLPTAVLRAYGAVIRQMAQNARTKEVVPSLLALAYRFDALADQQEERHVA